MTMDAYAGRTAAATAGSGALTRYVVAAILVRAADGGAAAGLVLLAVGPAAVGASAGGLLAAALTAPHLLGPWAARVLDGARDGRAVLAAAFTAYGAALAGGALLLGRAPLAIAAATLVAAGACGPLLTGGLSSRLASLAPGDERAQRRAEGWDAVTYGVGGTAGPALVAVLAGLTTPLAAVLALAGAAVAGAAVTLTLPRAVAGRRAPSGPLGVRAALGTMLRAGPLRRVGAATMVTALSFGAMSSVLAVVLARELHGGQGAGAALVAAFGLGNLAGSLLVTAVPLRGEPERLVLRFMVLMGVLLAACAAATSLTVAFVAFALAGASNAPFFAATLAARSSYAPEGARAQVFVSMAGAKIAASAAGTALAGAAIGAGPRGLIGVGAALVVAAAAVIAGDRWRSGAR